jgi:hypothetical protein
MIRTRRFTFTAILRNGKTLFFATTPAPDLDFRSNAREVKCILDRLYPDTLLQVTNHSVFIPFFHHFQFKIGRQYKINLCQ